MHPPRRTLHLLLAGLGIAATTVACGADANDSSPDEPSTTTAETGAPPSDVVDALDAGEALDALGVEGVADALVIALDAERYEIDGETVHLYLSDESPQGVIACVAASAVVPEGTAVVVHDGTGETPC